MIYKITLGLVSVLFGLFAYTESGFSDPFKTLFAAIFLLLGVSIFLDNSDGNEKVDTDD